MAKAGISCVCGYDAAGRADLDQHILAMMHVDDGQSHAEAH